MEEAEIIEKQRKALKDFMHNKNLNANAWAKKAGIAEATIRHYLSGRNNSLTLLNIEKLAIAAGVGLNELINYNSIDSSNQSATENPNLIEIEPSLFIEVCQIVEKYIIDNKISNIDVRIKTEVSLAWYQLIVLFNAREKTNDYINVLADLIYESSKTA